MMTTDKEKRKTCKGYAGDLHKWGNVEHGVGTCKKCGLTENFLYGR